MNLSQLMTLSTSLLISSKCVWFVEKNSSCILLEYCALSKSSSWRSMFCIMSEENWLDLEICEIVALQFSSV